MLKIGCCGFPRARQEIYRRFPVVEVQQTFYEPPQLKTLERWRAAAPQAFEFTLKAWQMITHPASSPTYRRMRIPLARPEEAGFFQATETVAAAWALTRDCALTLGARVLLFQCPARFTPEDVNIRNLRRFFETIKRDHLDFAWEPRGDWPDTLVRELCRELRLIPVVDPLQRKPFDGDPAYFRLHGFGNYSYRYSDDDLNRLLTLCLSRENAYVLFNNTGMFEDAQRFQALVGSDAFR